MNDLIAMALQGGRYTEAENQLNNLILNEPNADIFYLLGTVKFNLILDNNRSFDEVVFCFNKALNLTSDKKQLEQDILIFCLGTFKQFNEIQAQLEIERKKSRMDFFKGIAITYIASSFFENSKSTFGSVGSIVGISLGVGLSLDALKTLGDIPDIIIYLEKTKKRIIDYLNQTISDKNLLSQHFDELIDATSHFQKYDNTVDTTALQKLNKLCSSKIYIEPAECVELTKADLHRWARNIDHRLTGKGDKFKDENIICGIAIELGKINFVFTDKGIHNHYGDFTTFHSIKPLSSNMLGVWVGMKYFGPHSCKKEIVEQVNLFIDHMKQKTIS
jgi:hypothetical protein